MTTKRQENGRREGGREWTMIIRMMRRKDDNILGIPDTSFNGRSTRTARSVLKSTVSCGPASDPFRGSIVTTLKRNTLQFHKNKLELYHSGIHSFSAVFFLTRVPKFMNLLRNCSEIEQTPKRRR